MKPHCHIVGPGALGGLFAFRLNAAGFHVSLIGQHLATKKQKLTLLTRQGQQTVEFPYESSNTKSPINLLWVTTKSYAALNAVTRLSHRFTSETVIVTLGNGMGYHNALSTLVSGRLIAGSTTAGCSSPSAQTRQLAGEGKTRLGWWAGAETAPDWFAKIKDTSWCSDWESNIEQALLEKLAINCVINPMTALLNIPNGQLLDSAHQQTLATAIKEVASIFKWWGHTDIAKNLPHRVGHVISDTAQNSSSMRSDRQRQATTEHEEILGYLLERSSGLEGTEKPSTPLLCSWLSALRQPYPNQ
jgi:2-dehydropantoate 2-reductase